MRERTQKQIPPLRCGMTRCVGVGFPPQSMKLIEVRHPDFGVGWDWEMVENRGGKGGTMVVKQAASGLLRMGFRLRAASFAQDDGLLVGARTNAEADSLASLRNDKSAQGNDKSALRNDKSAQGNDKSAWGLASHLNR